MTTEPGTPESRLNIAAQCRYARSIVNWAPLTTFNWLSDVQVRCLAASRRDSPLKVLVRAATKP